MPIGQHVSLSALSSATTYTSKHNWPTGIIMQAGDRGLVLKQSGGHYYTAFFEVFPDEPSTFIRGEGKTIEDAEADAWAQWQAILACPGHELDKGGYENGSMVCRKCGLFVPPRLAPAVAKDVKNG